MRTSIYEDRLIDININIAYHCIIDGVSASTEISPINLDNVNVWAKRLVPLQYIWKTIRNKNNFHKIFQFFLQTNVINLQRKLKIW